MNIELRDIEDDDFARVLELNDSAYPAVPYSSLEEIETLVNLSDIQVVAVDEDGRIVGFIIVMAPGAAYDSENYRWFEARGTDFLYVDRIVIEEESRGNRIGQILYEEVFDTAQSQGRLEVTCEVNLQPPNPGSMAFHKRLGFIEVGQQETKGGKVVVALLAALV